MPRITEVGSIFGPREPYWQPGAGPVESLSRMAGERLGELLAETAATVADVCFHAAHGTTFTGPLDAHAVRAYSRFEASARSRMRELARGTRAARGESAPLDFDATHSAARHVLAGGSLSDTEAHAHGLGDETE